ncbi:MAG: hypothetical protein ACM3N4_10065 [Nitrososphaerota archaeon]
MTKSAHQRPRRHKQHSVRRVIQPHGGGGRPLPEETGLQLPQRRFLPLVGYVYTNYPKLWKPARATSRITALWIIGVSLVVIVVCLVLALLRAA